MTKDLKIAGDLADDLGATAPLAAMIRDMWADACDDLGAAEDFTSVFKHWEAANED